MNTKEREMLARVMVLIETENLLVRVAIKKMLRERKIQDDGAKRRLRSLLTHLAEKALEQEKQEATTARKKEIAPVKIADGLMSTAELEQEAKREEGCLYTINAEGDVLPPEPQVPEPTWPQDKAAA